MSSFFLACSFHCKCFFFSQGGVLHSYLNENGFALSEFETIQPVKTKVKIVESENKVLDQEEVSPFYQLFCVSLLIEMKFFVYTYIPVEKQFPYLHFFANFFSDPLLGTMSY